MIALWVGLGALVGAPLRYLTDWAAQRRFATAFPVGTLLVNLVASFVLGVVAGASDVSATVAALVGTGFCGALSTWSTFAYETVSLRLRALGGVYLAVSVVVGVALATAGRLLGTAL